MNGIRAPTHEAPGGSLPPLPCEGLGRRWPPMNKEAVFIFLGYSSIYSGDWQKNSLLVLVRQPFRVKHWL